MSRPHSAHRRRPPFRPIFSLILVYFFGFFFLFCLLLVAPALFSLIGGAEPGPELQAQAQQVAHEAIRGRLPLAFLAALVTTGIGLYTRRLPGLREQR